MIVFIKRGTTTRTAADSTSLAWQCPIIILSDAFDGLEENKRQNDWSPC